MQIENQRYLALRITIKSMLNVHTFDQFCWFGANANLHLAILIEDNIFLYMRCMDITQDIA